MLLRGLALAVALAPTAAVADGSPLAAGERVVVPAGTPVVVETTAEMLSNKLHANDPAGYVVANDVVVNGHVVARAGDAAAGIVKDARAGSATATRIGRGLGRVMGGMVGVGALGGVLGGAAGSAADRYANLRLTVDSVTSFCGDTVRVSFDRSEYHPSERDATKPVKVAKGQRYVALVAADQTVCGTLTSAAPAAIPDDALRSSVAPPPYAAPVPSAAPTAPS